MKGFNTKSELVRSIEETVRGLLLSINSDSDSYNINIQSKLHFTPIASSAIIGDGSSTLEFEAMNKVLQSGKTLRKGGLLLVPLLDSKGHIIGILVCEKKLSNYEESDSALPHISVMFMSDSDEEAASVFSCLVLPLLDKVDCMTEAYSGIQQAGQAIAALQKVVSETEDKLASSIAQKVALEATMQGGIDVLNYYFKPRCLHSTIRFATLTGLYFVRTTVAQLIDFARRAFLSVTSSSHCFIVVPGVVLEERSDTVDSTRLLTFEADSLNEIDVHLDDGDIEMLVLEKERYISLDADSVDAHSVGHSWSLRRAQSKLRSISQSEFQFVQVVPLVLKLGSSEENHARGFVTTVRKSSSFNETNKESALWLGRLLSLCLEHQVEQSNRAEILPDNEKDSDEIAEYMNRVEQLEREARELAKLDSVHQRLQGDVDGLQTDLLACISSPSNLMEDGDSFAQEELIQSSVKTAFGMETNCRSWQLSNPIDTFELVVQLDNILKRTEVSPVCSVWKDSFSFGSTAVTMWVDLDGAAFQNITVSTFLRMQLEEQSDPQKRLQTILHTMRGVTPLQPDDSRSNSGRSTAAIFQQKAAIKGDSDQWILLSSIKEASLIKLRFVLMMNLIICQFGWTKKLNNVAETTRQVSEQVKEAEAKFLEEQSARQRDADRTSSELSKIKELYKSTLEKNREKYKALLHESTQQKAAIEGILMESTAFSVRLRNIFHNTATVDSHWLLSNLINITKILSKLSETEVSVGLFSRDSLKIGQDNWNRESAISEKENALQICMSSGRMVLLTREGDKWEAKVSALLSLLYDSPSKVTENKPIVLESQEENDSCFFLPILSVQTDKVIVARIDLSDQSTVQIGSKSPETVNHAPFFGALVISLISIKEIILHETSIMDERLKWRLQARATALRAIQVPFLHSRFQQAVVCHAFEALKAGRLEAKLRVLLSNEPQLVRKLNAVKFQLRNLERSSADWKELLAGLNAASSGISDGQNMIH